MSTHRDIQLSSNWSVVGVYGGLILILISLPLVINSAKEKGFHSGTIIGGIILLAFIVFMVNLFNNMCEAKIMGDKVVLKKQFTKINSYSFDRIGSISSINLAQIKFITVKMRNDDSKFEKYIIIFTKSRYSAGHKDAEHILADLKNSNSTK